MRSRCTRLAAGKPEVVEGGRGGCCGMACYGVESTGCAHQRHRWAVFAMREDIACRAACGGKARCIVRYAVFVEEMKRVSALVMVVLRGNE